MPATIGLLGRRVRHAVFVACTVPDDGKSAYDMLDPAIQELIREAGDAVAQPMPPEIAKMVLGDDLSEAQYAWCVERLVAEAPGLTTEAVDLAPLGTSMPRTWVRTLNDVIVSAEQQLRYVDNVGNCPVVDVEAGHMCMVSRPDALASIVNGIATG